MGRYNVGYFTGLVAGVLGKYLLQESMWLLVLGTIVICTIGVLIAQNIKE